MAEYCAELQYPLPLVAGLKLPSRRSRPTGRNRPHGRYNRRTINRINDRRHNAKGRARARQGAQPDERPVRRNSRSSMRQRKIQKTRRPPARRAVSRRRWRRTPRTRRRVIPVSGTDFVRAFYLSFSRRHIPICAASRREPDVSSIGTNIIKIPSVAVFFFSSSQRRVR